MSRSGYVLAGFETLAGIINNFINNTKGRYKNNFSRKNISNFLLETCSGFLHSYGQNFAGKRTYSRYNKTEASMFTKSREYGLFDDSELFVDSGGFQISIGRLSRKEAELLLEMYYRFLEEFVGVYEKAFILDVPPGPGCEIFTDFRDVYEWNLKSYLKAVELPSNVRDKIVYIHHFRTPRLWEAFSKILKDYEMFSKFEFHGTGGVVANMSGDMNIPCIIYVIPIIPLLNECKKANRNFLNFHILGGANFRDVFFYELFKTHVMKKHQIQLNITYDSAGLFKGLMIGRFIQVLDGGILKKLNIKSMNLDKRFQDNVKVVDIYGEKVSEMSTKFGFKPISFDEVYDKKADTFFEEIKVYTMLYMLNQFSEVQNMLKETTKKIYSLYESEDVESFTNSIMNVTSNLNGGKITRKQKSKAYSVSRSLDMLTDLDEDYCKFVVNKFLSKDEFYKLDNRRSDLII